MTGPETAAGRRNEGVNDTIQITPEMLRAGWREVAEWDPESESGDVLAARVYRAMEAARHAPPTEADELAAHGDEASQPAHT
jgi:hypothetical protein